MPSPSIENRDRKVVRVVPCRIGPETFAIDLAEVIDFHEVAQARDGALDFRGRAIPIVSLRQRLKRPPGQEQMIISLRGRSGPWALAVDQVEEPVELASGEVHPLPWAADPTGSGMIRTVVVRQNSLWLRLDMHRVLAGGQAAAPKPVLAEPHVVLKSAGAASGAIFAFLVPSVVPVQRDVVFAISAKQVLEIIEETATVPVPLAPPHLAGLIAWRQRPTPVIDIGRILDWDSTRQEKRNFLIARGARVAATVAVPICAGARSLMLPIPHQPFSGNEAETLLRVGMGCFEANNRLLLFVDIDRILGDQETAGHPPAGDLVHA